MTNEVTTINDTKIALPADLAALFGEVSANVTAVERVNTLRLSGKVWKAEIEGEVNKITTTVEGEIVPVPMLKVIIVNQNPNRSRAFFEGLFEEGESKAPVCWSSDSKHPDSNVTEPKAKTCEECTESKKKTKFDDSNPDKVIEYVPCKFSKRIAVVQANRPDSPALRLQLAITSLWEAKETAKAKEIQGWYAFDAYCKMLAAKGITHTAMARTILKFDDSTNQPKVLFKFDGLIDAATAAAIVPRIQSEEVAKCLGLNKPAPQAVQQAPAAPQAVQQAPAAPQAVQQAQAAPQAVQIVESDNLNDALSMAWD